MAFPRAAPRNEETLHVQGFYHEPGRIVSAPTAEAARARLVADWLQAHQRGERAVMLANRRHDVADLNQRARVAIRELGRIGGDQLVTGSHAFAVGDRVVARRNDRRHGIVNGETGHIAAIVDRRAVVRLDDGRTVEIAEAYARAGHVDHGYALTAHLAQGATVERAFVLGSDELYREWGYTALSRHTTEARFYVSATPAFLNRSDQSLHVGRGTTRQIARMLGASRAQLLALDGTTPDPQRSLMVDELDEARRYLPRSMARSRRSSALAIVCAGTSAAGGASSCVASRITGTCSGTVKRTSSA